MQTKDLIDYYKNYFDQLDDFSVIQEFEVRTDCFFGVIKADMAICELMISVQIPFHYPYEEIVFSTKSIKGYPHLIQKNTEDYWFCLNSPFVESIEGRLEAEIDRLREWILAYLNKNRKDNHYDYPIITRNPNAIFYFYENTATFNKLRFQNQSFGEFLVYQPVPVNEADKNIFFADKLGNLDSPWQSDIKKYGNSQTAYWVYINKEPVRNDGTIVYEWNELKKMFFDESFSDVIVARIRKEYDKVYNQNKDSIESNDNSFVGTPLAVGYKIPSTDGEYEIHWDFCMLYMSIKNEKEDIFWLQSTNISKERFFGRGGFTELFCKLNILVIGVGAIGSSLAEILVRGGVRNLVLQDGDVVEHGNICRGNFHLWQVNEKKVLALAKYLMKLSPFANIKYEQNKFLSIPVYSKEYPLSVNKLKEFDLIFDCTASNELLYFLSNIQLDVPIISLCITNGAKQLLCLTNNAKDSLFDKRKVVLHSFGENLSPSFYEGTGCYYPTFRASYFDINALLNYAMKRINNAFIENNGVPSFHLNYADNSIDIIKYNVYYQYELNFSLTVFRTVEEKMAEHAKTYYPMEFGGIIVGGYSQNGKHIYITDILTPNKYINSPAHFFGDTAEINHQLEEIHIESQGSIIYLGDWHSHTNMSNKYSSVDFHSIQEQAHSDKVSINNPLMAIISIGRQRYEIGYYIYYEGRLYKFGQ